MKKRVPIYNINKNNYNNLKNKAKVLGITSFGDLIDNAYTFLETKCSHELDFNIGETRNITPKVQDHIMANIRLKAKQSHLPVSRYITVMLEKYFDLKNIME